MRKRIFTLVAVLSALAADAASRDAVSLPAAGPDLGGVTFDFVAMSAARFPDGTTNSLRRIARTDPVDIRVPFCEKLDGTFAVSEGQVGEVGFVICATNADVRARADDFLYRMELPRGLRFAGATFARSESVTTETRPDGSSVVSFRARPDTVPTAGAEDWNVGYVLVTAERGPGACGNGRLTVSCAEDGLRFENASRPIAFTVVPTIRTARPKVYANGSFCGAAFAFDDPEAVRRVAAFMGEAGVSWLIPPAARTYPWMDVWRESGFRWVTPNSGGWCANGYELGDGNVPEAARFKVVQPFRREFRWLEDRATCPLAVIEHSDYWHEVVKPTIEAHLQDGVDGMWANWEPYMFQWRGCGCERCGREFAKWLGRSWLEIYPDWPRCAFPGGRFETEGHEFRSWLHGRMVRKLDSCVRAATGGERSLGLIPGVHFEQMLSGWRRSPLMIESRPIHFADSLAWINPWGPYLPWHVSYPYEEERGRYVGHWVAAFDIRAATDADYPAGRRPRILAAPQGMNGDYAAEPEVFGMELDAQFFNRIEACCPWTFPSGADARYWRAFAEATSRAAKYEDFVFGGRDARATTEVSTIPEYAAPVARVLRNMPWVGNVPQLLFNAYERDGVRIVAVFNCWSRGEAICSLRCAGLEGRFEVVSDDGVLWAQSREETAYDADGLETGVQVIVGASRCRVFEIRPEGATGPTRCAAVMTEDRIRRHYAARRKTLEAAARRDCEAARADVKGMIRYD